MITTTQLVEPPTRGDMILKPLTDITAYVHHLEVENKYHKNILWWVLFKLAVQGLNGPAADRNSLTEEEDSAIRKLLDQERITLSTGGKEMARAIYISDRNGHYDFNRERLTELKEGVPWEPKLPEPGDKP